MEQVPDTAKLNRLLVRAWETSRQQWPTVELPADVFVTHLAGRLPEASPDTPLEERLEQLSQAELYLACACLRGIPSAIELFERNYLAKLPAMLRGRKRSEAMIDEACQLVRVKLLVSTPEGSPKIADYKGRGALLNWVRVTAERIILKLEEREKPSSEQDSDIIDMVPGPGIDTEIDLIRRRHHTDFRQAVREAFSALAADERHLLRLYFVDRLSMYELAPLFRVNQSTVSRWLRNARQRVYEETKRRLQARLGLSSRDFKSFLAVIDSQLDVSISQLLGKGEEEEEEAGVPRMPKDG